jgi:hypothetical protein
MTALSLRRLWVIYKKILADEGTNKRDLILAQGSFYSGARGVLKVRSCAMALLPCETPRFGPRLRPLGAAKRKLIMCVILRSRERRTAPAQAPFVFRVPRQRVIVGIISAAKRGAATVRNAQVHEVVSPLPIQPARRVGNGPNRHAIAWLDPLGFHGESFQPQHR